LARKEAAHLQYTQRTQFAQTIDANWVRQLEARPELAEAASIGLTGQGEA